VELKYSVANYNLDKKRMKIIHTAIIFLYIKLCEKQVTEYKNCDTYIMYYTRSWWEARATGIT